MNIAFDRLPKNPKLINSPITKQFEELDLGIS